MGPLDDGIVNSISDGPRLKYFTKKTTEITDWLVEQNLIYLRS